jgi:chaperonin cofactor prefoldin
MIVGSLSVVIYAIIGRNPDEVSDLTTKVESQQKQIETLVEQKDAYEAQMISLQKEIISAGSEAFKSILNK